MDKIFFYELQIPDTGQTIYSGWTHKPALNWEHWARKRVLKDGRIKEETKQHVRQGNTIVGWANADELQAGYEWEEFRKLIRHVFRGMSKE